MRPDGGPCLRLPNFSAALETAAPEPQVRAEIDTYDRSEERLTDRRAYHPDATLPDSACMMLKDFLDLLDYVRRKIAAATRQSLVCRCICA